MKNMASHQNVVQFLGYCLEPLCIVTEFCGKGSLDKLFGDSNFQMEMPLQLKFMHDIAKGMHHLYLEGIIHKDLASRNVLITESLDAKVADFGLSKLLEDTNNGDQASFYIGKNSVGPLKWMAPEAVQSRIYSTYSDVWSFGITCIEILTR